MRIITAILIALYVLCACSSNIEQEPSITDSTDQEYAIFKTTLFYLVGDVQEARILVKEFDLIDEYEYKDGEDMIRFAMGQTVYLEHLEDLLDNSLYFSKTGKFFMFFHDEQVAEGLLKVFCEMEDTPNIVDIPILPLPPNEEEEC